jgi:hypothetical protein
MPKFLCNVVETYDSGEYIIVLTDVPESEADYRNGDIVEFRKADGPSIQCRSERVIYEPAAERPLSLGFKGLKKTDVPIGSQVWLLNSERAPLKPNRYYEVRKSEERRNSA